MSSTTSSVAADFNPYNLDPRSTTPSQPVNVPSVTPPSTRRTSRYAVPAPSAGASGFVKHKPEYSLDAVVSQSGDHDVLADTINHRRAVTTDARRKRFEAQLRDKPLMIKLESKASKVSSDSLAGSFARFSSVITMRSLTKPQTSKKNATAADETSSPPPADAVNQPTRRFRIPQSLEEWEAYNRSVLEGNPRPRILLDGPGGLYPRRPFIPGTTPPGSKRSTPRPSPHQSPRPGLLDLPPPVVQAEWERRALGLGPLSPKPPKDRSSLPTSPRGGSLINLNLEPTGTPPSGSQTPIPRIVGETALQTASLQVEDGTTVYLNELPAHRSSAEDAQLPPGALDPSRPRTSGSSEGSQRPKLPPIVTDFSSGSLKSSCRRSWMGMTTKVRQANQPEPPIAPELDFLVNMTKTISKEPNPKSNNQRLKNLRRSSHEGAPAKEVAKRPPPPAPVPLPGALAARQKQYSVPDASHEDQDLLALGAGSRRRRFSVTNLFGSSGDLKNMSGTKAQTPLPNDTAFPEVSKAFDASGTIGSVQGLQKKISPQDASGGDVSRAEDLRRRRFSVTNLFNRSSTDIANLEQIPSEIPTPSISQMPSRSVAPDAADGDQTLSSAPDTGTSRRRFSVTNMFNGSSRNLKAMIDSKPQDPAPSSKPRIFDGSIPVGIVLPAQVPTQATPRARRFSITDIFSKKDARPPRSSADAYSGAGSTPSGDYVFVDDDDTASSESFHRTSEQRRRASITQGLGMWRVGAESTTQLGSTLTPSVKPASTATPTSRPLSVGGIISGWERKPSQDGTEKKSPRANEAKGDENIQYLPVIETGSSLVDWL